MKAMVNEYAQESTEALEAMLIKLDERRTEIKAEQLAITKVLDERRTRERAQQKLSTLSPGERAALAQMISAGGIESGEQVSEV
jgi:septal ring factor EnvC (AmiA/AmiB activator)